MGAGQVGVYVEKCVSYCQKKGDCGKFFIEEINLLTKFEEIKFNFIIPPLRGVYYFHSNMTDGPQTRYLPIVKKVLLISKIV